MYTSLPEMWEGWTKNIFLGLNGSAGMLLLGALGAFLSLVAALALPLPLWLLAGLGLVGGPRPPPGRGWRPGKPPCCGATSSSGACGFCATWRSRAGTP
jgi:hypothetical protein